MTMTMTVTSRLAQPINNPDWRAFVVEPAPYYTLFFLTTNTLAVHTRVEKESMTKH